MEKERQDLLKELDLTKKEIIELKDQLNKSNYNKETWFKNKENLRKEIYNSINKFKEIKKIKDEFNINLQNLKKQRDNYNKEVKNFIESLRQLKKQRTDLLKKYNFKINPLTTKDKILQLEQKIETEGLQFKDEQKLMKKINQLKKIAEQTKDVENIVNEINSLYKKIEDSRKKADDVHKKIKQNLKLKTDYKDLIDVTNKIDSLKKQHEDVFKKFLEYKNEFSKINHLLKEKLIKANYIKSKMNEIDLAFKLNKEKEEREKISEKTQLVENKLKRGEKLTREDLIVFQHSENE